MSFDQVLRSNLVIFAHLAGLKQFKDLGITAKPHAKQTGFIYSSIGDVEAA